MRIVRGILWGLIVAWIGVWIWLGSTVDPWNFQWSVSWPLIFSLVGLIILVEGMGRTIKRARVGYKKIGGWAIFWGVILIALGIVIWFSKIAILPAFSQLWPFIFVVIGLAIILNVIVKVARKPRKVSDIIDKLEEGKIDVDGAVSEIRRSKGRGCGDHE